MQQIHPIPPLFCSNSKVLILGSFPSVKSREQAFFYGHSQNRFWKVTAAVFNCPVPVTVPEKKSFILSHQLALWDVIAQCEIRGSSDASIKNAIPNDLSVILNSCNICKWKNSGKILYKIYLSHNKYCRRMPAFYQSCQRRMEFRSPY